MAMIFTPVAATLFGVAATTVFAMVFYAMLCFGETRQKQFAYIAMLLAFPSLIILFVALSIMEQVFK